MTLCVYDYADKATLRMIKSLSRAGMTTDTVIIHYEGYLYKNAYNPFVYYMKLAQIGSECFFNEIEVPDFYEIRHINAGKAHVLNGDQVVGKIIYIPNSIRLVQKVEWLSTAGQVISCDFYNEFGMKYATSIFDEKGRESFQLFYNQLGKIGITWNKITGLITLEENEQFIYYENLTQFILKFLKDLTNKGYIKENQQLFINSLSYPLFLADLGDFETTLFWQEKMEKEVPGNMQRQLKGVQAIKKIIFENQNQLEIVQDAFPETHVQLDYLSALFQFKRHHRYGGSGLIATYSDDIYFIEEVLTAFPNFKLTITAPTEMSAKLLQLKDKYSNVTLLPQMTQASFGKLFSKHDIYLNLNEGAEVFNAFEYAFDNQMILLNLKKNHKKAGWGIEIEDQTSEMLLNCLEQLFSSKEEEDKLLKQGQLAGGKTSTLLDYQKVLGK